MRPILAVLAMTDAFAQLWPELAAACGADLRLGVDADAIAPLLPAFAAVAVTAGDEERSGLAVRALKAGGASTIAVVAAEANHHIAVAAVRAGAEAYFALPADHEFLRRWLLEQAARWESRRAAETLAAEERERYDFSQMVGRSPGLRAAIQRAARIIPRAPATVLLTGETGTGKELLAHAIHHNGPRAAGPIVEINCTSLPPTLLEAELFGYERGAFTDARTAKAGLFEIADGGTLFLDEIGDLSLDVQAKLLRVLEDRHVRRLGSLRSVHLDVRLIAATHVDLAEAVRAARFRSDLYYRLNVVPIHLPPLRERGDDVLLLARHFLERFAREYDVPQPGLTPQLRTALLAHSWPGNVRELRNVIERLVLLGLSEPDELFPPESPVASVAAIPFPASMATIEVASARAMVQRFEGNKTAAAEALGISRSRLYRLIGEAEGV